MPRYQLTYLSFISRATGEASHIECNGCLCQRAFIGLEKGGCEAGQSTKYVEAASMRIYALVLTINFAWF